MQQDIERLSFAIPIDIALKEFKNYLEEPLFKPVIDEFCYYILINKYAKNTAENICKNIHPFSTS